MDNDSIKSNIDNTGFSKKKKISFFVISILSIFLLLILIHFFIKQIIYTKNPKNGFLYTYAKVLNVPAVSIYGEKINYVTFNDIINKNIIFYKKMYYQSEEIPTEEAIKEKVEKKLGLNIIIKNLCNKYNIGVTDREVYDETKKYIEQFGSEKKLNDNLISYYDIDVNFFQENYIKTYLLKNKLDNFIRGDDKINRDALKTMKEIKNKLNNTDFLTLAKYYNDDIRLQESSGVINWIDKNVIEDNFGEIKNIEIEKGYITDILKNKNGYYIIKIIDINNIDIKNQKVKIAVIKKESLSLDKYLQKQYNNIKIREYIN